MGNEKESFFYKWYGLHDQGGAVLIYAKKLSIIFFSRTLSPMILKLGMQHQRLKLYQAYINDDCELTLSHFKTISILRNLFLYLQ